MGSEAEVIVIARSLNSKTMFASPKRIHLIRHAQAEHKYSFKSMELIIV
jgi:hypothetical protein